MTLKLGSTDVSAMYVGATPASAVYVGTTQVWPTTTWHSVFPWSYSWVADDLATGSVASWVDGQAGKTLGQANGAYQPVKAATSGANGQPGVTFDGVHDYLQSSSGAISVSQPNTVILILATSNTAPTQQITDGDGSTGDRQFVALISGKYRMWAGTIADSAAGLVDTSPHTIDAYFNGASSAMHVDGVSRIIAAAGSQGLAGFTVGARYDGATTPFVGVISAVGIVSGDARTSAAFGALQAFVASKWGLTL